MAAVNMSVHGRHIPGFLSNAKLLIIFNQKFRVHQLWNLTADRLDLQQSENQYSAVPEKNIYAYVPSHILQSPNLCRSHLTYILRSYRLNPPPVAIDRLAFEVVSTAAVLSVVGEDSSMGFDIQAYLEVIGNKDEEEDVIIDVSRLNMILHEKVVVKNNNGEFGDECCSVCLEELCCDGIDELIRLLPCNHLYHPNCIAVWLHQNSSCPLCRRTLW
ncbi:uncharacterized protein LOC112492262 [Ziziphus jujuba]|uniref:RING-type E3 ubiquitin transferase n=1 Tax=Ziziphus jujuba TaxID=326968 RepID=A0A6P6GAK5_ZIZJJ|nr:uncharacterized protein LOC112492262 [Ziziphus jujuba]